METTKLLPLKNESNKSLVIIHHRYLYNNGFYSMMEITDRDFNSTMKATNHWLPFIIGSNITVVNFWLIRKKRKKKEISNIKK